MADKKPPIIGAGYQRLLLVEGDTDGQFFFALAKHLQIQDRLWVYQCEGEDNIRKALEVVIKDDAFENLRHIGIVRDADFTGGAFQSVRDTLIAINNNQKSQVLPIPNVEITPVGDDLKVSIMIMPRPGVDGMVENLILEAYQDDPAMGCVEDYFTCLQHQEIIPKQTVLPKAKVRVFMAAKAVDSNTDRKNSKIWDTQYIFMRHWWSWQHPTFDTIKAYLQQLVQL